MIGSLESWGLSGGSVLPAALAFAALALLAALFVLQKIYRNAAPHVGAARAYSSCVPPPLVPPVVAGLPLLGSALDLGSGGAAFLQRCRKQVTGERTWGMRYAGLPPWWCAACASTAATVVLAHDVACC